MANKKANGSVSSDIRAAMSAAMKQPDISEEIIRRATQDPVLEQNILGACLQDPDCLDAAVQIIEPGDFTMRRHIEVWGALQRLSSEGFGADVNTVSSELSESKTLDSIGGTLAIQMLTEGVQPIGFDIDTYAKMLRRKTIARRLVEFGMKMGSMVAASDSTLVERAEAALSRIAEMQISESEALDLEGTVEALPGKFDEFIGDVRQPIVPFPWQTTAAYIDGMRNGELIILAGRPGTGKSIAGAQIASFATKKWKSDGLPGGVLYCSLEMTREALFRRLLCCETGIRGTDIKAGTVATIEREKASQWRISMQNLPLFIVDKNVRSVAAIKRMRRRKMAEAGVPIRMIVIDHMHLMSGRQRSYQSQVTKFTEISGDLKQLAKEEGVPILALAQLSRANEQREDKRPQLSDLRESGSLEQDSDVVLMLHSPEMYNKTEDKKGLRNSVEVHIKKQRDGSTGTMKLQIERNIYRMSDLPEGSRDIAD